MKRGHRRQSAGDGKERHGTERKEQADNADYDITLRNMSRLIAKGKHL